MKSRLLLLTVIAITATLYFHALALAQGPIPSPAPAVNPLGTFAFWAPIVVTLLGLIGNQVRNWTPSTGFFHTALGHSVLMAIGAILGAICGKLSAGQYGWQALGLAAIGALAQFLGALKTTSSDAVIQIATRTTKAVLLPIAFFGLVSSSCAHTSPSVKQWGASFGSCMEQAGITDASGLGPKITAILEMSGLTKEQLIQNVESLGISTGGTVAEQVAVCAFYAFQSSSPAAPTPTPAQAAVKVLLARHAKALHPGGK